MSPDRRAPVHVASAAPTKEVSVLLCPKCGTSVPPGFPSGPFRCSFCGTTLPVGTSESAPPVSSVARPGSAGGILSVQGLSVLAKAKPLISDVSLDIPEGKVTAIIGPSGCGKTTLLRSMNRMVELHALRVKGKVLYQGRDIYDAQVNPVLVRRRIGMVFQRPTVFPTSVYENVAFGLRLDGESEEVIEKTVVSALHRTGLWDEVKGSLDLPALTLSGGQQQRLCIARALAVSPRVLLMDEPTSSLDPVGTQRVEDLIFELKNDYTVVIVTHNMQQAARVADLTAFMYQGRLIEFDSTKRIFEQPREKLTENYITGRFG
ncbi:MAG: phosphate ABC transporter ATP-binding protein [Euryarchaeota archaeon]|nr:phosphate ABC transporter ATP-binding protein [Euryarchaeota archaeon]MDE1882318.1 phosphate ABC transporter ATP-binding protein [Euryarchaeota archaeon]MDE2046438.1 phosphate ABC transporter ATP-binding protein [Thermoplasmata archaeon]